MRGEETRALYGDGGSIRLGLPLAWVKLLGWGPGDRIRLVFDGERIVLEPAAEGSPCR